MELKSKFNRVAYDNSQLQDFANSVCDLLSDSEGEWHVPGVTEEQVAEMIQEAITGALESTY